ncbi:MAG TPA: M48 family metallopeptidase [Terriglobales bacterium]|nr:M48 family metallopeptidase [Terriglobales bacterium]
MFKRLILIALTGLLVLNICQGLCFAQTKGDSTTQSQIQNEQQKNDRLVQAIKYQKAKNVHFFVDQGYSILVLIIFLFLGLSAFLRRQIEKLTKKRFWLVLLYALVFIILAFIVGLPSSYYGFHLEQKYQLSNQNFSQWFGEQLKGLLVIFIIGVLAIEGIYFALKKAPRTWWIYVSIVFVFFTVLLINLAPVLIMPLFNTYNPLPQGEIRDKLIALSDKAGVKVEGIYEMNMSKQTKEANAMFTGIGNTKRIVLGDNLIKEYTPDEIEVVIAHEMGHNILHHIWKMIALMSFVSAVGFLIIHLTMGRIINRYKGRLKIEGPADIASLPLFMLIFVIFSLITLPVSPTCSRYLEHQADKYALDLTCNPEAFISAMNKLTYQNLSDPNPSPIIEFLLYDHPPASKRIKFAESYIK